MAEGGTNPALLLLLLGDEESEGDKGDPDRRANADSNTQSSSDLSVN